MAPRQSDAYRESLPPLKITPRKPLTEATPRGTVSQEAYEHRRGKKTSWNPKE